MFRSTRSVFATSRSIARLTLGQFPRACAVLAVVCSGMALGLAPGAHAAQAPDFLSYSAGIARDPVDVDVFSQVGLITVYTAQLPGPQGDLGYLPRDIVSGAQPDFGGLLTGPVGIAVHNPSGTIYVSDSDNQIVRFNLDRTFSAQFGSAGSANGQFNSPAGLGLDSAGNIYVADRGNHRIQKFTNAGGFVAKWGSLGSANGQFNNPTDVTVDGSGNVYVADRDNHRIQKFNSSGAFVAKWGSLGSGNAQFNRPSSVTVDAWGQLWVADRGNNRIVKYSAAGVPLVVAPTFISEPVAIATSSLGDIYVIDAQRGVTRLLDVAYVTAMDSTTPNGTYRSGAQINVQLTFSRVVTVTGTPRLQLETGATDRFANYVSGSGTDTLNFTYTVVAGDSSPDLEFLDQGSLKLNGGTIVDGEGHAADVALIFQPYDRLYATLGSVNDIVIDTTIPGAPSTPDLTAATDLGTSNADNLTSDTTPTFTGTTEPNATIRVYRAGTTLLGSTTATAGGVWTFTVPGAAALANGTHNITARATNSAGFTGDASPALAVTIDTSAPAVTNVSSTTANGTYGAGAVIALTVTFNQPVTVTTTGGTPRLTLETGATDRVVNYASGSGTATLTFNYTVQSGDSSADLDYLNTSALALNGGTIRDASGNNATLTLPAPGAAGSLGANKALVVATQSSNAALSALALSAGSLSPAFAAGSTSYTVALSYPVNSLTVTPTLADPTASVRVNGASVASGTASGAIPLAVGANTLTVRVTAQDGTTTRTYTLTVTRSPAAPGDVDPTFVLNADWLSLGLAMQPDGKSVLGGLFTTIGGVTRNGVARLNANATLDSAFDPNADDRVHSIWIQPDGKILFIGNFSKVGGTARAWIARLNADGTLDAGFHPTVDALVSSLVVQPDGKILLCGSFTTVSGATRNFVARIEADGTLDAGFNPNANSIVHTLAVQPDGKILLGGDFTQIAGAARTRIARLNADGSLDASFNPSANAVLHSMALQADGKILILGSFRNVNDVARNGVARLNVNGTLDLGFDPNVNGWEVFGGALQADGKIFLSGPFTSVNGTARSYIVRLNADGTTDVGFNPNPADSVLGLTLQADGKILISGRFESVGGIARNYYARLTNDAATQTLGATSPTRVQWLRSGATPEVSAVTFELSTNGGATWIPLGAGARVSGGWELTGLTLPASGSLRARGRTAGAAYFSSSGLIQQVQAFNAPATPPVIGSPTNTGIAPTAATLGGNVTSDGNAAIIERGVVVAPTATNGNPRIGGAGVTKFATSGTTGVFTLVTTGLAPLTGYSYAAYATNSVGTSYTSVGTFTTAPNNDATLSALALSAGGLSPAFAAGTTSYTAIVSNPISSLTVTPTLVDAGASVTVNGTSVASGDASGAIALAVGANTLTVRVTAQDGTTTRTYTITVTRTTASPGDVDTSSDPNGNGGVFTMAVQPDGKTLVGGAFTSMAGETRNYIARVNADGSLDATFDPNANGALYTIAVQADGKILIGGFFTSVGGVPRNRIARLNADGSLDGAFNPDANNDIHSMALQADGNILVAGVFTSLGGVSRNRLARLNPNGTVDLGFEVFPSAHVYSIAVQPDGKILIAGTFTSLGATTRNRVARLNADGSVDTGFDANADNFVYSVGLQADGKILLAGDLTSVGGVGRNRIARVNANGTLDLSFNPNVDRAVTTLVVQADGKIVLGGTFTRIGGTARYSIARLNADGTLDTGFDPNANGPVYTTAAQADGKILVGGQFTDLGGTTRIGFARLTNDAATQTLAATSLSRVQWLRGGAAPEVSPVSFELSTNGGATWALLGAGTRIPGGWELTGLTLPASGMLRGRGRTIGGRYDGSTGLVEQVQAINGISSAPVIASPTSAGVTPTAATLGGNVLSAGSAAITERGVVLAPTSLNANPQIGGASVSKITASGTTGVFTAAVSGLAPLTSYSYAAYATNAVGTSYTAVSTFTTAPSGNAALSALTLNAGTLSPVFAAGTTSYTADVANLTSSLTVTPTLADTAASMTVNGTGVASGAASDAIALAVGGNTLTVLVTAQDGTTTRPYTIVVTRAAALNNAPTLAGGPSVLTGTNEITSSNAATVLAILAGTTHADADIGALSGIAITATTGAGTWQYSTDGLTWTGVGAVSASAALLLSSDTQVRYVPGGVGETATFTFRAWDQTSGAASTNGARSTADTTANGGMTAFSTGTAQATIVVTDLNDAPVLTPAAPTLASITENNTTNSGVTIATILGARVVDPDPGAFSGLALIDVDFPTGTAEFSTDGGATWNAIGAVSLNSALLLRSNDRVRFVPDTRNAATLVLAYRAWDRTGATAAAHGTKVDASTAGGTTPFSNATDSATLTATAVNDAPTLAGGPYVFPGTGASVPSTTPTVAELLDALTEADVDNGAVAGIAVTAATGAGNWQFSTDGGTWTNFGAVSASAALLLDASTEIRYLGNGTTSETATLTFRAWDRTSGVASAGATRNTADPTTNGGATAFSTGTAQATIAISAVPPAPVVLGVGSPADNGAYRATETLALTIAFNQPIVVTGAPRLQLNSGASVFATYASGSGTGTLTFTYTIAAGQTAAVLDYNATGALTLNGGTLRNTSAIDAVLTLPTPGAAGSLAANKNLAIDTTAPAAPTIVAISDDTGASATDHITSDATLVLSGIAEPNSRVTLTRAGAGAIGTVTTSAAGAWTFDYRNTVLGAGDHVFTATATDAADNSGPSSVPFLVTIDADAGAPAITGITSDTGFSALDGNTSDATLIFFGTAEPGSIVTLNRSGVGAIGTATTSASGLWSYDHTATTLPEGSYLFTATIIDGAGNTSASSADFPVVIDTTAPDITSPTTLASSYRTALSYSIATATAAASYSASGLPTGLTLDPATGVISGAPTQTGTFNVTLGATDLAGNNATAALMLTIMRATVTVSGITATDKIYDGTSSATISLAGVTLGGVFGGDTVALTGGTGAFSDASVGASKVVTISGLALAGASAGNYQLASTSATARASIIAPPPPAITPVVVTLGNLTHTYDGSPKAAAVSTIPEGIATSLTYNGSLTPPANAGTYTVQASVNVAGYSGSASATLTIARAQQTIDFVPASGLRVGDPFALRATSSAGLRVAFEIVKGNASLESATLTCADGNTVVVRATQPGSENYAPATPVEQTISDIAKLGQTIAFAAPVDRKFNAASFALQAAASSGLPVAFALISGPATLQDGVITFGGTAGDITIRASQPGNAVFAAAPDVERTFHALPLVVGRFINISARARAGSGPRTFITGFVIGGGVPKQLLARAVGPGLAAFGLAAPLADPILRISHDGVVVAENANWAGGAALAEAAERVGAFPLEPASADAALLTTLNAGPYNTLVTPLSSDVAGAGVVLTELYSADRVVTATDQHFVNFSVRAEAGTGDNAIIVGFVVNGETPAKLLLRGVGPGLAPFGIGGTLLPDPRIQLFHGSELLASNDDASGETRSAGTAVGAFVLEPGTKDAALLLTVNPGAYTLILGGAESSPGIALVEVYELP